MPRVYIDTNIFKFSATELRRLVPRDVGPLKWGDITIDSTVYDIVSVDPNKEISNEELKREAEMLHSVAEAAKNEIIDLIINHETLLESWGLPNMDSMSGKFYNAPYEMVEGPVKYQRVVLGYNIDPVKEQYDFLCSLKHPRFIEIQKATGAYQGENKINRNQLIDAWNIWCAEHADCGYMLTMDLKLIRMLNSKRSWESPVKIVKPSQLLNELQT
jgi:hypothetical protein